MDITSATNARTMIGTVLDDSPCGNSAPVLGSTRREVLLCSILNSLAYDYQARARCGGLHLNCFVIEETALLSPEQLSLRLGLLSLRLVAPSNTLAVLWQGADPDSQFPWKQIWAVTLHERLRLRCILDAIVTALYALDNEDLSWILRDCDYPTGLLRDKGFYRTLDPKGFWRVDKDTDPELRHTVLTLVAFRDLKETIALCGGDAHRGIEAFCSRNGGEGWMLPETLCLADLGLGHDDRARKPRPVRSRLGERFFPWQLEQSVEDSWKECELHARNILGAEGFTQPKAQVQRGKEYGTQRDEISRVAETEGSNPRDAPSSQRRLFSGEKTLFGDTIEDPPGLKKR